MLNKEELGKALVRAMELKGVSQADVARHFKVKPPSVTEWIRYGRISKGRLNSLVEYFSDVVGPEHWGLPKSTENISAEDRMLLIRAKQFSEVLAGFERLVPRRRKYVLDEIADQLEKQFHDPAAPPPPKIPEGGGDQREKTT